jgi:hypothetical protein|tara:strand:+ start:696 stop:911 length:216 start_codon:yes stop_codon:yes gene_type:complete
MTKKEQLLEDIQDHNDSVGSDLLSRLKYSIASYEQGRTHHRDLLNELKAITEVAEIDLIDIRPENFKNTDL